MFKITGLDELSKKMDQLKEALAAVDGELGKVSFDPQDPASIETAISEAERLIEDRLAPYQDNSMVVSIAEGLKETYRQQILDKAAEARLHQDNSNDHI